VAPDREFLAVYLSMSSASVRGVNCRRNESAAPEIGLDGLRPSLRVGERLNVRVRGFSP
jgi:hypothetical protein